MSFHIVSTSEKDFNMMWEKINKLTTLVYPQYTQGRMHSVADNSYKFIQPFSQLIGASPMIRIRLGNLFRSNYSKFALARLFGAEMTETRFGNTVDAVRLKEYERIKSTLDAQKKYKDQLAQELRSEENILFFKTGVVEVAKRINPPPTGASLTLKNISLNFEKPAQCRIVSVEDYGTISVAEIRFLSTNEDIFVKENQYFGDVQSSTYLLRDTFFTDFSNLEISAEKSDQIWDAIILQELNNSSLTDADLEKISNDRQTKIEFLEKFLSPENNALVKSFKSASGKGLAGFIESMSFDWYSNVTWDVDSGRKAPKMCKVTISFSPIHDISPGLDYNGYNRAPIYPLFPTKKVEPPKK
jgi:hypothetical protein